MLGKSLHLLEKHEKLIRRGLLYHLYYIQGEHQLLINIKIFQRFSFLSSVQKKSFEGIMDLNSYQKIKFAFVRGKDCCKSSSCIEFNEVHYFTK